MCDKTKSDDEVFDSFEDKLKVLDQKISELEESMSSNFDIMLAIEESILVLDDMLNHTLVNRAINRTKLKYLKDIVLPRRIEFLKEIKENDEMPDGIKKKLLREEINLVEEASEEIEEREKIEENFSATVKSTIKDIIRETIKNVKDSRRKKCQS